MIMSIVMINSEIGNVNSGAEKLVDIDGMGEVYSLSSEVIILFFKRCT